VKKVYLAGPIRRVSDDEARVWRDMVSGWMRGAGFEPINPLNVENVAGVNVVRWDLDSIRRCAAVFAQVPDDVPMVGTPMEIFYAASLGIPVYVFGAVDPSPWVRAHSVCVYEHAVDTFKFFERNEHARRW